jgi:hypothetical protein
MGPSGIMSLDSFGDVGGAGAAGVDTAATGGANPGAGFSGRGPTETKSDFEARVRNQREIIQKAEQRQAERLGYNERRNISNFKSKRGPFGIGSLFSTVLGFINPALGLISRGITSVPGTFQTFKQSKTLADFINNMKNKNNMVGDDDDDETLLDQVSPELPFAKSYLQSLQPTNIDITGTNFPGANQTTGVNDPNSLSDDLDDFNQGVEPGYQIQARDGGRIQYMNGGLTDLVDIYD